MNFLKEPALTSEKYAITKNMQDTDLPHGVGDTVRLIMSSSDDSRPNDALNVMLNPTSPRTHGNGQMERAPVYQYVCSITISVVANYRTG